MNYHAFLLPILSILRPVCVSEDEKNQYQNNIRYTGGMCGLLLYVALAETSSINVIKNVLKFPETSQNSG